MVLIEHSLRMCPEEYQQEIWHIYGCDERGNFIRRQELSECVGIEPLKSEPVGSINPDMPPYDMLGTEKESRILHEFRMMQEATDATVQNGYLQEISPHGHCVHLGVRPRG
jgi:hypothetical protein